ncbi:MAG: hypothetical protein IPJ88_13050 [Myxococcales bacterium]|nr:MAG: hypothetical protein IPJ88_13050 [Myxococcales bacterium]
MQFGQAEPRVGVNGAKFLAREELLIKMKQADAVISHGGCGSLLDAISAGHCPIVVPRLARFGEIVNDHQLELAEQLVAEEKALLARDIAEVEKLIPIAKNRKLSDEHISEEKALVAALRSEIREAANRSFAKKNPLLYLMGFLLAWLPVRRHKGLGK